MRFSTDLASTIEGTRRRVRHAEDAQTLRGSLPELPSPVARPVMVVVSGLPGSGKSYFSRRVAGRVPLLVLESDALRRVLFPEPSYTASESGRLFNACHTLINDLLREGVSLLLDATNLVEGHREVLYHIAEQVGAKQILVYLKAPPGVIRERLQGRSEGTDPEDSSTADWEVYRKMSATVEPIRRNHFVVDSSRDITPAIDKVVREIRRWMRTQG